MGEENTTQVVKKNQSWLSKKKGIALQVIEKPIVKKLEINIFQKIKTNRSCLLKDKKEEKAVIQLIPKVDERRKKESILY